MRKAKNLDHCSTLAVLIAEFFSPHKLSIEFGQLDVLKLTTVLQKKKSILGNPQPPELKLV
jgi:hypothetical protein